MDKTVLLDPYVNECTKGCDIGHDAREFHSCLEVFYRTDIVIELKLLSAFTRVKARLAKF